jgi:predicted RNA-binding protein with PIN domain
VTVPVLVLVDGSNVARCSAWRARHVGDLDSSSPVDDVELRRRLVDALCSWASVAGVEVQVVFDGAGPWRAGKVRATAGVTVIGSGRAEGDDVVERRAANAHRDQRAYWIVTSDRALQHVSGARAERVVGAEDFVLEL